MSRDLNYFTEFLEDPSTYSFDEFFKIVREWGTYILDHKDEFNYLEDDEWKEIRERIINEFEKREDKMDEVDDEWDDIGAIIENAASLSDKEKIELYERQIQFMKDYKSYFKFTEESINELAVRLARFVESARQVELLDMQIDLKKIDYEKSIAELDDELVRYYERTGKIPRITAHLPIKKHKGN